MPEGKIGKRVSFKYRSGGGQGRVVGYKEKGKDEKHTYYHVKPFKEYRHPGEPEIIVRRGDKLDVLPEKD